MTKSLAPFVKLEKPTDDADNNEAAVLRVPSSEWKPMHGSMEGINSEYISTFHQYSSNTGNHFLYPYTPLKGVCAYTGYKRTNPMNKTNYKSSDVEYYYFHLFCVYKQTFSHHNRVLDCQF